MTKFLPYQQYDIQAIESWLNKHAQKGLRLEKMDGVFPKFKKNYDRMVYYRVRYALNDPPKGYAHYWGNLYIYETEDPADLPNPSYEKGSVMAAQNQKTPWFALALLISMLYMAKILFDALSGGQPLFLAFTALAVAAQAVWLVTIGLDWKRGRDIARGTLNPAECPPGAKNKAVQTISSILAIAATIIAIFLGEGVL